MAAGYQHSLALTSDGRVTGWGISSAVSNQPPDLENVIAIAAGSGFSLALRGEGSVVSWGDNASVTNVPGDLREVVAVAAGGSHALALRADGSVFSWGANGLGRPTNVPAGLSNVVAIAAGDSHSLALKADGTLVAWGSNSQGQTNVPPDLRGEAREVYQAELHKKIRVLLEKSVKWYRENLLMIERLGVNTDWAEKSKLAYAKLMRLLDPKVKQEELDPTTPRRDQAAPPAPTAPGRPTQPAPGTPPTNEAAPQRQIL